MAAAEQVLLNGFCSSATESNCQSQTTNLRCEDDRKGRTSAAEETTITRSVGRGPARSRAARLLRSESDLLRDAERTGHIIMADGGYRTV